MPRTLLISAAAIALVGGLSLIAYLASGGGNARVPAGSVEGPPAAVTAAPAADAGTDPPGPTTSRPAIISRREWNAKEPLPGGKTHTINCITIHHTGVPQKTGTPIEKKLQNLQSYSQGESRLASGKLKPAWLDVPYHFYISVDGKIAEGRPIRFVSDTNTEYDPTNHATVVVEGNFETEQPTAEQQAALEALAAWLAAEYRVPAARIKAHNDYAKTACPGVNLKRLLPALREKVAERTPAPGDR